MNWNRVKKATDVTLQGCTVDIEKHDSTVRSVTVRDAHGNALRIAGEYGLTVVTPAPPEKVKRFAVVGEIAGVKVDEVFEHEHLAMSRRDDLNLVRVPGTTHDAPEFKIEPREVEVTE